jgi:SAM-dependent methyltransferase
MAPGSTEVHAHVDQGAQPSMSTETRRLDTIELEQRVKRMYQEVALAPDNEFHFEIGRPLAERLGYPTDELDHIPSAAVESFAGVGYFLDLAAIAAGESVLDLGSGSGTDSFLAALAAGPDGRVIGIDMTEEQLIKARDLAVEGGLGNVDFRVGYIEQPPVDDGTMDCVISNGVINLAPRQARGVRGSRWGPAHWRTPGAGRHRHGDPASRWGHVRRLALGRVHRRSDAAERLPRGDRGGELRDRGLAREPGVPVRVRAGRQRDAEVRRHEHLAARAPHVTALAALKADQARIWGSASWQQMAERRSFRYTTS